MSKGIDVYTRYQVVTNWRAVRQAGYTFCYVKLCDGTSTRNEGGYTRAGRAAGLSMGGYHFAQPGNAAAQADLLVNRCEQFGATQLAPCLDLEGKFTAGRASGVFAVAFLRRIAQRGHTPCLYANNSTMRSIRAMVLQAVPQTIMWVARYGASPSVPYTVWQWSQSGHVPGIRAGSVDLDKGGVPLNRRAVVVSKPKPKDPNDVSEVLNMDKKELQALVANGVRDYFNPEWHNVNWRDKPVSLRDTILGQYDVESWRPDRIDERNMVDHVRTNEYHILALEDTIAKLAGQVQQLTQALQQKGQA